MLVQALVALLASTAALAAPLSGSPAKVDKRDATSDLIAQLRAADSAVQRNQILAAGGNSSFAFDFSNPPSAAVVSSPAGKLVQATGSTAPFLTDINAAMAVVVVEPCGLILPHLHPRADEFVIVIEGELYTQFIAETGAVLIENELKTLGATLLPKGSIHLEYNPTCQPATFVAAFNNNDPGVSFVGANLFSLNDQAVIADLGGDAVVSGADLASIRHALPEGLATGVAQCVSKCGIKPYSKRSLKEVYGL